MVFEDANTIKQNPIIRGAIQTISPDTSQLKFKSLDSGTFSKALNQIKILIQKKEQGEPVRGNHAEVNVAKCALACLLTMHERHSWLLKQRGYEVRYNLYHQMEVNDGRLRPNQDSSESNYFTWLVDTDGLNFNSSSGESEATDADADLSVLNHARSITVQPLWKFINIQARTREILHPNEVVMYQGQHPSRFNLTGSYTLDPSHNAFVQQWESDLARQNRVNRYGTDHLVIFLHPNAEILEYGTNEEIRIEKFEDIALGVEDEIVIQQTNASAVFSTDALPPSGRQTGLPRPPLFLPRTPHKVKRASAYVAANLAGPTKGLLFSRQLRRDRFFELYSPQSQHQSDDWESSWLQGAIYFKKYKENTDSRTKVFAWTRKIENIMSTEKINGLLSTFKYTVRRLRAPASSDFERQVVWNRPQRCNGITKVRIDDLPEPERQRVETLYGDGYGGYKPCERRVNKHMRCAHHRQGGPRGYYDS